MRFAAVRFSACLGAGVLTMQALAGQPQTPSLSRNDREVVRTMLKQVREDVERYYYDPAFRGIDMRARFSDADVRLQTTDSFNEAIAVLTDSLNQLGDSHTAFYPPNRATRADYGWQMAMVGDAPLIVAVAPDSDATAQGLAPGDRVLALNRFQPTRENIWQIVHYYRFIRPQAQQHLVVRKPDGSERALDIKSKVTTRRLTELPDLIEEIADAIRRSGDRDSAVGDVFIWRMTMFGTPDAVQRTIARARRYKAVVLDLRNNGGGAVNALSELVSRTFDRDVQILTERRRAQTRSERARSKEGFGGRLIVLVDSRTASAAEIFARLVQLEKRGTVVGDRTGGMVMTAQFFPHTIGVGAVAFYATSVTVGDVRMSDGQSLERVGVTPDEIALPAAADLAAGRDPVLARAIALAGGSITPERAGRLFPNEP